MVDLVLRYKRKAHYGDPPTPTHSIPPPVTSAICHSLGIDPETLIDRLTTPLLVQDHTRPYWSAHPRDKAFRACTNAYTHQWTGYSIALTSPDHPSQDKALRWALWSAHQAQTVATATILFLPRSTHQKGGSPHLRWGTAYPTYCTHITRTTTHPFPLSREASWTKGATLPKTSKYHFDIILVWNSLAQAAARPSNQPITTALTRALKQAITDLQSPLPTHQRTQLTAHPTHTSLNLTPTTPLKGNCAFRRSPPDSTLPATLPTPSHQSWDQRRRDIILNYSSDLSPLRHDWEDIAYTDGSCIQSRDSPQLTGAAVFLPKGSPQFRTVDPTGQGATNTINRAELAGLWGALACHASKMATDSATSLHQIRRAIRDPMSLAKPTSIERCYSSSPSRSGNKSPELDAQSPSTR